MKRFVRRWNNYNPDRTGLFAQRLIDGVEKTGLIETLDGLTVDKEGRDST
jgi:hypothetical protein